MIREIALNNRLIQYDLIYKDVKNINLRIRADQTIFVSANVSVQTETIDSFLQDKADYILKALYQYAEIAKYSPKPKAYISGESFRILGRDLRLTVFDGAQNTISTDETYIYLTAKDVSNYEVKKRIMEKWINTQCKDVIQSVCEAVYLKFKKYDIDFPQIRFREMVSRWGSCQPKRKMLTFNKRLIEAPLSCIEYVVVHEFVHFLQPNHSKAFYQQLFMFMPDWEQRKALLEKSESFTE